MTHGILHDIGKFALYSIGLMMREKGIHLHNYDDETLQSNTLKREEHLIGVNHAIIGGMLANKWNLSERICSVIECHHQPSFYGITELPENYTEDIAVICIADLVVNQFMGENNQLPIPHNTFFDMLNLQSQISTILTEKLKAKLSKAREFVKSLK